MLKNWNRFGNDKSRIVIKYVFKSCNTCIYYVIFIPFVRTFIVGFVKRDVSIEYHVKVLYA